MFVLIRADATPEIGSGHVMRCAALGMRMMVRGALVHFACADMKGWLARWLLPDTIVDIETQCQL